MDPLTRYPPFSFSLRLYNQMMCIHIIIILIWYFGDLFPSGHGYLHWGLAGPMHIAAYVSLGYMGEVLKWDGG